MKNSETETMLQIGDQGDMMTPRTVVSLTGSWNKKRTLV